MKSLKAVAVIRNYRMNKKPIIKWFFHNRFCARARARVCACVWEI